jgi:hypothetical protein
MSIRLAALLLLSIFCAANFAACDQAALSLAEYRSLLQRYQQEIQATRNQPQHAAGFYREVPSSYLVKTPSANITVTFEFLRKELGRFLVASPTLKTTILSQLAERLQALQNEADNFEKPGEADPATRERLNRILASREFRGAQGPTEWELLKQRISVWIENQFKKLSPKMPDLDQAGSIFVWVMIAIASSALALWLYRRSRERLIDRPREILSFPASAKSWRVWLAEAREKAAMGSWREAIRLGFWAAVSKLEAEGAWRPDTARTPREYLSALPSASSKRIAFASATKTFEAAWYGGRASSAVDFESFMTELEKLGCSG